MFHSFFFLHLTTQCQKLISCIMFCLMCLISPVTILILTCLFSVKFLPVFFFFYGIKISKIYNKVLCVCMREYQSSSFSCRFEGNVKPQCRQLYCGGPLSSLHNLSHTHKHTHSSPSIGTPPLSIYHHIAPVTHM